MSRLPSLFALVWISVSFTAWGYYEGSDPRYTGAPGDHGTCTSCHGAKANVSAGSVTIVLSGDSTYMPGVKQQLIVKIADPTARRWGFELTARLNSNLSNGQAGSFSATDTFSVVTCDGLVFKKAPCASASVVQFMTHTTAGTRLGTTVGVTFGFDWTPPSTDVGKVTLYVAANAANGNGSADSGDHIYTTSLELSPASATPATVVSGVVSRGSGNAGTAPASWIAINGTNLSNTTRTWTSDESAAGLPTTLDGVTVQVNGKPAFVQSVSPTQIVALTPSDTSTGPVGVEVNNNGSASTSFSVSMAATAPALLVAPDKRYLVTSHGDNLLASRLDNLPSVTLPSPIGATPGEVISFYGTGFGPVDPAITDGTLQPAVAKVTTDFTLTIGGQSVVPSFAGLAPGFAGVYQFKTTIPASLALGDQPVVIQMAGQSTQSSGTCCYVQVVAPPKPVITSAVSAASQVAGTAQGSWIAINGTNLATSSRSWTSAEATATTGLPTTLDGVSVQVNGIAAFVQAVSPTQLLVLTPSDTTSGSVNIQVTTSGQISAPFPVSMAGIAPALFTADGKYLVTTNGTDALDKRPDVYPATSAWPTQTWPTPMAAKPGETISFYGTGFGPTDTAIVDGQLQGTTVNVTTPYTLIVGGEAVMPSFAGLAPGFAGVYLFTLAIPPDLPNGDQAVVITIGGLSTVATDQCCFVKVQSGTDPVSTASHSRQ